MTSRNQGTSVILVFDGAKMSESIRSWRGRHRNSFSSPKANGGLQVFLLTAKFNFITAKSISSQQNHFHSRQNHFHSQHNTFDHGKINFWLTCSRDVTSQSTMGSVQNGGVPGGSMTQHAAGLKYRSQVTGHNKNTCEFVVRLFWFVSFTSFFLVWIGLFIPTNPMMSSYFSNFLV